MVLVNLINMTATCGRVMQSCFCPGSVAPRWVRSGRSRESPVTSTSPLGPESVVSRCDQPHHSRVEPTVSENTVTAVLILLLLLLPSFCSSSSYSSAINPISGQSTNKLLSAGKMPTTSTRQHPPPSDAKRRSPTSTSSYGTGCDLPAADDGEHWARSIVGNGRRPTAS